MYRITAIRYSRMYSSNFRISVAARTVNNEQFLWLKGSEYKEVEGGRNSQIPVTVM